jgi:hypothetical protein
MLYKTGIDLSTKLIEFISNSTNLFIFVPYIKVEPLKQILNFSQSCKAIVVRWNTKDILLGSSDLELYTFCKERNISLYRNPRLHLKAFIDNYKKCFLGSANISARGLDMPKSQFHNYELGIEETNLSIEDRYYFNVILNESMLITDSIFQQIKTQLSDKYIAFPHEDDLKLHLSFSDKHFLMTSLPMTLNVKTLLRICETKEAINEVELNCVMHDLALYGLPLGLKHNDLRPKLKEAFFNHPFIQSFLENLSVDGEIYFGKAKDWIQRNCTDVPTPRKWEITENIQILYKWVEDLGEGKYAIDQPNHSERLYIT